MVTRIALLASALALLGAGGGPAGAPIVAAGKAEATIVVGAGEVAGYAARELVYHIEKATGVKVPVVAEAAAPRTGPRIYLGDCQAARAAGIDASKLAHDAFTIKTDGEALYIVGEDLKGNPIDDDTRAGTLWGVYEWLEQVLKVRWLWPGELGTYVPKSPTVTMGALNQTTPPRFAQRKIRPGPGLADKPVPLGFTAAAQQRYIKDQEIFLRRHRMGRTFKMSYGHAFTEWWDKHGKQHPEWFQLLAGGQRGPSKKGARFSMCVSNPEFQKAVVEEWIRNGSAKNGRTLNACENDVPGICECEPCKAWDGPPPADFTAFIDPDSKLYGKRFVSDRYARFMLALQKLASQTDPDAIVVGYAYMNYFVAPTSGVKLNPNIWVGYCPTGGWFPRTAEEQAWIKRQWTGWAKTGAKVFWRPNYFLDGHTMPYIFAHQFADEFKHAVKSGMTGTDFDSLTGQWSTQGTNLYLLMRLHVRPDAPADELLGEYYAAFGAAGSHVKAYFNYWEKYTKDNRDKIWNAIEARTSSHWKNFAKVDDAAFPEDSFKPADSILKQAEAAVGATTEAGQRVAFLRKGYDHALLCVKVASLSSLGKGVDPAEYRKALDELVEFRRKTEGDYISNFASAAWCEESGWNLPKGLK